MIFTRIFSVAIVLAGITVGLASPASAAQFLGVYRFESTGGDTSRWVAVPFPECGPTCANVGVTQNSNLMPDRFSGLAKLENGRWNMTVYVVEGVRCELNQQAYPGKLEYSWDAASLSGTALAIQTTPNCGRPALAVNRSDLFTLTAVAS